jgi:hypothetical protein
LGTAGLFGFTLGTGFLKGGPVHGDVAGGASLGWKSLFTADGFTWQAHRQGFELLLAFFV